MLQFKSMDGKKFYFIDFGSETHGRTSFRLWINRQLVKETEEDAELNFPVANACIEKTPKGSYVLRPKQGYTTFDLFVPCGYRGSSEIEILKPEPVIILNYYKYRSPRGSLGVAGGAVASVYGNAVYYKWYRSGRLYGSPSHGISILKADGTIEELDGLPDGLEAMKELEDMLS